MHIESSDERVKPSQCTVGFVDKESRYVGWVLTDSWRQEMEL
jgi:hypothetical protein